MTLRILSELPKMNFGAKRKEKQKQKVEKWNGSV